MKYKNKFFAACPKVTDPDFVSRIILIVDSDEEKGEKGLILNGNPIGKIAFGIMPNMDDMPANVGEVKEKVKSGQMDSEFIYIGGPCDTGMIMLHNHEDIFRECYENNEEKYDLGISYQESDDDEFEEREFDPNFDANPEIVEGLYFGGPEILGQIYETYPDQRDRRCLFLMGSAKWASGQFEEEINQGFWEEIEDIDPELLFDRKEVEKLVKRPESVPKIDWSEVFSLLQHRVKLEHRVSNGNKS
jgi:putative AlgH/UPF0301 family transcriptional regulator